MEVAEIKTLPKEFDFKTNINSLTKDMIYHAKENGRFYEVTWNLDDHIASCSCTKLQFWKHLKNKEFVVCK